MQETTLQMHNSLFDDCPRKLADRRKQLGWTIEKAAEVSGLSVSAISRFEAGETKQPKAYNLAALCAAYHTSLDILFGIEKQKTESEMITELKDRIAYLQEENRDLRRSKKRIALILGAVVVAVFLWFVLVDGQNGTFGLIQYALT